MVLTAGQITFFFEDPDQCRLSNCTRVLSLNVEGVATVDDLSDWEDDEWDRWALIAEDLSKSRMPIP